MEEPPGGENFGYRRSANGVREPLNYHDWVAAGFLAEGGWIPGKDLCSVNPRGRPRTIEADWLTPAGIAAVEQRLGFTRDDFHRAVRKGRLRPEDRALRESIATKLSTCVDAGAAVAPLAQVLGCSPRTLWRLVQK
jgi:hypothetical protein